jgi:chromosome segregation ATPase
MPKFGRALLEALAGKGDSPSWPDRETIADKDAEIAKLRGRLADALAVIDDRDAEIADLRDRLAKSEWAAAELQAKHGRVLAALDEKGAESRDQAMRAERAEGQLQYAAIGLQKLSAPSGMTIAARASLAAQMLTALDVPAEAETVAVDDPA